MFADSFSASPFILLLVPTSGKADKNLGAPPMVLVSEPNQTIPFLHTEAFTQPTTQPLNKVMTQATLLSLFLAISPLISPNFNSVSSKCFHTLLVCVWCHQSRNSSQTLGGCSSAFVGDHNLWGGEDFAVVILKFLRWGDYLGYPDGPKCNQVYPCKREILPHTEENDIKMASVRWEGFKVWGDVATSQGMLRVTRWWKR